MSNYKLLPTENGGQIFFEAQKSLIKGQVKAGRAANAIDSAITSLESVFEKVKGVAESFIKTLENSVKAPDEVEISFGIAISTEGNMIIVSGTAEANMTVNLIWKKEGAKG